MRNYLIYILIFTLSGCDSDNKNNANPTDPITTPTQITIDDTTKIKKSPIENLKVWLTEPVGKRTSLESLGFATQPLTKSQSDMATELLIKDKRSIMNDKYGIQWDDRLLKYNNYNMPFYYKIFGKQPSDGRSLFISMHGGGNQTANKNNSQYENQKHLYDTMMSNLEGIYLAPRAPTNTWSLWHQNHIDDFFNLIIQLAVIKENVNPDKVYLMGYSAGGDGVYQLAPRMADRWAAASMMAGHPNETSPLGLRNLPFTIHVGALDSGFNRNIKAKEWRVELENLQKNNPRSYIHDVQVHEKLGHWMNLKDAVALPWMKSYKRNPIPEKVVWKQDNRNHTTFYWLGTPENLIKTGGEIIAEYNTALNEINIISNYSETINLFVNDDMLNLDKPVTIKYQDKLIHKNPFKRSILNIYKTLSAKGDPKLSFPCVINVHNNQTVEQ